MRVYMVLPSQHDGCQPNEKPLSNSSGDTGAYPTVSWLWSFLLESNQYQMFTRHSF